MWKYIILLSFLAIFRGWKIMFHLLGMPLLKPLVPYLLLQWTLMHRYSASYDCFNFSILHIFRVTLNGLFYFKVKRRGKGQQIPAKKMEDGLQKHLILPFIKGKATSLKGEQTHLAVIVMSHIMCLRIILSPQELNFKLTNLSI